MATLYPKTINLFHFTGPYQSTPNCPVELVPNFNPSSAAPTFQESDPQCSRPSIYSIPFFLQRPGPKNEEWTINAHEASPGHYTQVGYLRIASSTSNIFLFFINKYEYLPFVETVVNWTTHIILTHFSWNEMKRRARVVFKVTCYLISESRICWTFPRQLQGSNFVDSTEHILFGVLRGLGPLRGESADIKIYGHL